MTPVLLGAVTGFGAGAILLFIAHVAPRIGAGAFVRDVDELRVFGRMYSRREGHLIGVFLHLALSFVFGGIFAIAVDQGVFPGYSTAPLALYAIVLTVFMGGVVMPIEGHGLFGIREDAWFPVDLAFTNILWVAVFGVMMATWG